MPPVADQHAADPSPVLHDEGVLEPERLAQTGERDGVALGSHDHRRNVARKDRRYAERDDRDEEQRQDDREQSIQDVCHFALDRAPSEMASAGAREAPTIAGSGAQPHLVEVEVAPVRMDDRVEPYDGGLRSNGSISEPQDDVVDLIADTFLNF